MFSGSGARRDVIALLFRHGGAPRTRRPGAGSGAVAGWHSSLPTANSRPSILL